MQGLFQRIFSRSRSVMYKGFTKNLLVSNTVTCGVLLAGGDLIQQRIEKYMGYQQAHDLNRSGRMFAVGLSQGPPHHYWYLWLDKILPKTDLRTVALKIVLDQIFAAPFFAITFFFGMGVLEDKRMSECWTEFVKKFPTVYLFDWCIWPPTQYINFALVPPAFRVLYVNVVTVIWDVFLSYIKHYDRQEQEKMSLIAKD